MTLDTVAALVPLAVWSPSTVQKLLLSILGLAIIIAGIGIISRAGKANYSETARVGFNVIVGIIIAALGAGTIVFATFGTQLLAALGFNVS